ncbi:SagB family peptide dehydrogenase [Virgibacillus dokdonensis]|uniref:SagB family peptide dehydrogenase n=1 Tax=Virgibacillus dokdonensis TaxID=302167 RepID=UPI001592AF3A|nr:SagB family peptide dehydrogenase [Virgibacillus dokdonensis]
MKTIQKIAAKDIGKAVRHDPQFQLPKLPYFPTNTVQVPIENGVIFDGVNQKQVLRGRLTKEFLPTLLKQLDGKKTLEDLEHILPEHTVETKYDAIALLYSRGLIQGRQNNQQDTALSKYFERHLDQTRFNTTAAEAMEILKSTELIIHSTDSDIEEYLEELAKYPIRYRQYTEYTDTSDVEGMSRIGIGICNNIEDLDQFMEFDKQMRKREIPWILIVNNSPYVFIGPYFCKKDSLCFHCYLNQINIEKDHTNSNENIHFMSASASTVIIDLINFISRISPSKIHQGVKIINIKHLTGEFHYIVKQPYCEQCDVKKGSPAIFNKIIELESKIAFPPPDLLNPKDHQNHYKTSNLALAKESKGYYSAPKRPLKNNEKLPDLNSTREKNTYSTDNLAKLFLYTVGFNRESVEYKEGKAKRWTPTGGNLGSENVYFVNKRIEDLGIGTYFYQESNHCLATLPNHVIDELETHCTEDMSNTLGYVILTGDFSKVAQKYYDFAYKVIHFDAGVALTQFRTVAHYLNLGVGEIHVNEEKVGQALGIDNLNEIITVVLTIKVGDKNDHI